MTVVLKDIVKVLQLPEVEGDVSVPVTGVTHDSRKVRPGMLFAAFPGESRDGFDFVEQAVAAGASAVLAQRPRPESLAPLPWIVVPDARRALGPVAAQMHGEPSSRMTLVGITGTNGKTTLTFLMESILRLAGGVPGVIGTITYRWGGQERSASHTTPEASELQAMLAEMVDAGVTHAFMEVSSHGLHLGRLDGCEFDVGVFTNLTQDHLDYHGNIEDYFLAKRILFEELLAGSKKKYRAAVLNLDDRYGRRLSHTMGCFPVVGYGNLPECSVRPVEVSQTAEGTRTLVVTPRGLVAIQSSLTGSFNLSNILAAVAVSEALNLPHEAVRRGIGAVAAVPGRLERVPSGVGAVFVDYAHTPDALTNVLAALGSIRTARIITVMGCGGDRDRTKRPLMGMEAAVGSDFVVLTSDNPRTEDPLDILRQVEEGVRKSGFALLPEQPNGAPLPRSSYLVIPDRRQAIAWAVRQLEEKDILLVAGKGHETYQEIRGIRYPFDDRIVVLDELKKIGKQAAGPAQNGAACAPVVG